MTNSRSKGKRGELEAAAKLNEWYPWTNTRRGQQFHGGADSPDLVWDLEGIHIEVKRTEKFRIYDAMDQAIRDAEDKIPMVAFRSSDRYWLSIKRLQDEGEFVTRWYLGAAALQ